MQDKSVSNCVVFTENYCQATQNQARKAAQTVMEMKDF